MRFRESGMPSQELWDTFFNPKEVLVKLELDENIKKFMDIGCGYGTFLFPAAEIISGTAIGIDIDKEMIDTCSKKIEQKGISNILLVKGDISNQDIRAFKGEIDYISLFNILHCEEPLELLDRVYNTLKKDGKIGVIHWKYEDTPRGPSMEIRPKAQDIIKWAKKVGFILTKDVEVSPYHYGLIFTK